MIIIIKDDDRNDEYDHVYNPNMIMKMMASMYIIIINEIKDNDEHDICADCGRDDSIKY